MSLIKSSRWIDPHQCCAERHFFLFCGMRKCKKCRGSGSRKKSAECGPRNPHTPDPHQGRNELVNFHKEGLFISAIPELYKWSLEYCQVISFTFFLISIGWNFSFSLCSTACGCSSFCSSISSDFLLPSIATSVRCCEHLRYLEFRSSRKRIFWRTKSACR